MMQSISASPRRPSRLGQMIVSAVVVLILVSATANQLGVTERIGQFWVTLFSSPEAEAYKSGLAKLQTMERRNMGPALQDFTHAIELNPHYVPAYRQRSTVYFLLDMPQEGMADMDKAIELEPNNAELYLQRSVDWFAQGKKEGTEFMADLDKAIELKPDYFEALTVRGVSYTHLQAWDKALADLNKAASLKPWRIEPTQEYTLYANRGLVLLATGKLDEALADFDQTMKILPKEAQPYRNRGNVYLKKGQFKEAASDFLKSLELEPDFDLTSVLPDFQSQLALETDAETKVEIERLLSKGAKQ